MNEETKGDEREHVRGRKRKAEKGIGGNDYVIAPLYVTRALRRYFSTADVVAVPVSQTKHVTRKRIFRLFDEALARFIIVKIKWN